MQVEHIFLGYRKVSYALSASRLDTSSWTVAASVSSALLLALCFRGGRVPGSNRHASAKHMADKLLQIGILSMRALLIILTLLRLDEYGDKFIKARLH